MKPYNQDGVMNSFIASGIIVVISALLLAPMARSQSFDLIYQTLGFESEADYQRSAQICADIIGMPPIDVSCAARHSCLVDRIEVLAKDHSALKSNRVWVQNKCDIWLHIQRDAISQLFEDTQNSEQYPVQVSHNDDFFIINDEEFSAKTYCFDVNVGDMVIFTEGKPNGVCVSAEILNLRNRRPCRLWCE